MAEVNTAEVEATVDAAFGAGFGVTPPPPGEKVGDEPVVETPAQPDAAAAAPAPVPVKPQYVRLTKQEWDNTKAAAGKVAVLESQVAKLTGSLPQAEQIVQQVIDRVKAQGPGGANIDPAVLAEAFADQERDFPELAAQNRKAIEHILKNLPGTASSPASPVDMDAAVEKVLLTREGKALEKAYPDWSEIVGRPKVQGEAPPQTEFRQWLAKQPAAYQEEVANTHSPAELRSAIDKFKATDKAPAPNTAGKAATRRAVIEDAQTPRAEGHAPLPASPQSAEEAFASGFKVGKAH